jgi:MFS family permease
LERVAGEDVGRENTSMGKVAFASFIGTATEFYDFCRCSGSYIPVIRFSSPCPSRWAWSSSRLYGPMGAFLPELYGTRLRYSGAAVSYNLGWVFGGAFAPLIAGQLLASTGGSWSISLYVLAMAAVSFACIWMLSETHLKDLTEIRSEERRLIAEARESAAG